MLDLKNRRPLKSRETKLAGRIAQALAARGVTPNAISQASMGAALVAGLAFWGSAETSGVVRALLLVLAALGCQARLLCNLFDGMVAVEAGKGAPDGPFWNEFPDRVSDILILVGAGLAAGMPEWGWAGAALSVLTAYTRELGAGIGLAPDFSGPMAKPQRMAALTAAAVLAVAEGWLWQREIILPLAIVIVTLGTAATVMRRGARIVTALRMRG